jgi:hypothetical protein
VGAVAAAPGSGDLGAGVPEAGGADGVHAVDGGAPARRSSLAWPAAGCLAVAVVSLVLPASHAYDPWAWLVWGREALHLELDTTGGPSWKPLPVLAAAVVSVFGDLAPTVWLVAARTAGLLAIVLAFRLAARFAGPVAGALAAAFLVLTPDGGPRFSRLLVEGHADTLSVTLTLWAVERHLDGRRDHALLLGTALALMRPEAWPFLGAYVLWLWVREPAGRGLIVGCLAAVPVLWFGGDWWGSGSPWHGAGGAQVESGGAADLFGLAFERAVKVVVVPVWVGVGLVLAPVLGAGRPRPGPGTDPDGERSHRAEPAPRVLPALVAAALAWTTLVIAMSVTLHYAALSRFLLPAAGLLCVVGAVGLVRALDAVPAGPLRVAAVTVALAVAVPPVLPRVRAFDTLVDGIETRARLERELDVALDRAGGPDAVRACGAVAIDQSDVPRMALAWKLDLPLHEVRRRLRDDPGVLFARAGGRQDRALSGEPAPVLERLAESEEWVVYAAGCP